MGRTLLTALLGACLGALLLPGCGKKDGAQNAAAAPEFAVDKAFERGPLSVQVKLDKANLSLAERLRLVVVSTLGEGYRLDEPHLGRQLGNWTIADYKTAASALDAQGRTVMTREYILEPFLSGRYEIPAFTFTFRPIAADPKLDKEYTLSTDKLEVEVTSLLAENREKLDVAPLKPVLALPARRRVWLWAVAGGLVAGGLAAGGVVLFRRRRHRQAELRRCAAHELAYARLQRLLEQDLPGKGEYKRFYQEVSQILRQYIEDRFGLHAPERTTEEFLSELTGARAFSAAQAGLLAEFLKHCDLVKFAELQPTTPQIQKTFDTVKAFIEQTRIAEKQVALAAAA